MTMNAPACSKAQFDEAMEDALDDLAPELIPDFVRNLNGWTKSQARQLGTATTAAEASGLPPADAWLPGRKIGRNEPRSCGSVLKYKRCPGAH